MYTSEDVRSELLLRDDPAEFNRRVREKYIRGVREEQPAVISVNTLVAALAVNELLARIHCFRYESNDAFGAQRVALHEGHIFKDAESHMSICGILAPHVGRGDVVPLLDRPELTQAEELACACS